MIDSVTNSTSKLLVKGLIFLLLGIFLEILRRTLSYRKKKYTLDFKKEILDYLINQLNYENLERLENKNFQNKIDRFKGIEGLIETYLNIRNERIEKLVKYSLFLILIIQIDKYLGVGFFLFTIIYILLQKRLKNLLIDFWKKYMENTRTANLFSDIAIGKEEAKERKIFNTTNLIKSKFSKAFDDGMILNKQSGRKRLYLDLAIELISKLGIFLAFILLVFKIMEGTISLGIFFIVIQNLITVQSSLEQEISREGEALKFKVTYKEFLGYIDSFKKTKLKEKVNFSELKVKNISFKYKEGESKVIKNFSYNFKRGKNYLILGENGSGKSTLFKLLTGLYIPTKGNIYIDDSKISELNLNNLISVLFQEPNKYPLTIKENITFSNKNFSNGEGENYISDSSLIRKIKTLDDKFNSSISTFNDKKVEFSGGEWQKLFIGRLSYKKTPILFFDEPTSAMDPIAEREFYNRIKTEFNDSCNIIISHRLEAIKITDEILILKDGELIESGTPKELKERGNYYKNFK